MQGMEQESISLSPHQLTCIEVKHKPPPGFQACTLLPRPSSWSKGGGTWKMPNEGPIKNSLQRLRPLGHEKPLYPTPCHYHYHDSFYEQNILKVNSRGSLKNTQWMFNIWFSFLFSAISMPGLGDVSENLMEMEGRNRTTNPWVEYQWMYGESLRRR